jgi:hypothetical protein
VPKPQREPVLDDEEVAVDAFERVDLVGRELLRAGVTRRREAQETRQSPPAS